MATLFNGIVLFIIAFTIHLILWRIHLPRRQTKWIIGIFCLTLAAGLLVLYLGYPIIIPTNISILDYFHITLFFLTLTMSYIITYSAIEADSPTLVMIIAISDCGHDGMPVNRFYEEITDEILLKPRIDDLLTDMMAYKEGDRLNLTNKGALMAGIFTLYRSILGISAKGG